jgi:hypothetical protein
MSDDQRIARRRIRDAVLAWSSPALLAVCGFFLLKLDANLDRNTEAVHTQAVQLAQLQIMMNTNATLIGTVSVQLDRIRDQQTQLAERLSRVETKEK